MASKYTKKRESKYARLRKQSIPKASSGVVIQEGQPAPNGAEKLNNAYATQEAMGSNASKDPVTQSFTRFGAFAGSLILDGINAKQMQDEDLRQDKVATSLKKHGNQATNTGMMGYAQQAKNGLNIPKYNKGSGKIEIETMEPHFSNDNKLKNIGTRDHENGGNVVDAEVGDFVVPCQDDPECLENMLKLAKKARSGDEEAKAMIQQIRNDLPNGSMGEKKDEGDGGIGGFYDSIGSKAEDMWNDTLKILVDAQDKYENFVKERDAANEIKAQKLVDKSVQAQSKDGSSAGSQTGEASSIATSDVGDPEDKEVDNSAVYKKRFSIGDKTYDLGRGLSDGTYHMEGDYVVDANGNLPFGQSRRETKYDKAPTADELREMGIDTKEKVMDFWMNNQYNWNKGEQEEIAKSFNIGYEKDWLPYVKEKAPDDLELLGAGQTDQIQNYGKKNNAYLSRGYKPGEDVTGTITDYRDTGNEPFNEGYGLEDFGDGDDGSGGIKDPDNFWSRLSRGAHANHNMLSSLEPIEGYDPTELNLDRYKYYNMTAARLREAEKYNAIRRSNRRRLIGSKGQQVAQSAQDEVMAQNAADKIMADEINRHGQINNMNVDISNQENRHMAGELIKGKDITRAQRGAARNLRRAAMKEYADIADMNEQRNYMRNRNLKQDQIQEGMLKMMSQNMTPEYGLASTELYGKNGINQNIFNVMTRKNQELMEENERLKREPSADS